MLSPLGLRALRALSHRSPILRSCQPSLLSTSRLPTPFPFRHSPISSRLTSRAFSTTPVRRSPDTLFPVLATLNVLPFTAFWALHYLNSPLRHTLERYFLLTPSSSPLTLLTSGFFHTSPTHLFFNLFTLRAMLSILAFTSPVAAPVVLGTYIAGIVGGSLAMRRYGFSSGRDAALGASAGVSALLVAASCVAPLTPVNVMFIPIDIPLAVVAGVYFLIDAKFAGSTTSTVGHAAHLGGGAIGAVAWALLFRM
ncbi:hypothetical protein K461DRAFT_111949 [Myriangium duriaei CBS 260.36]|uniref:Peptidase S54 rhomboid domain-containing protein n=1 Tax=Myriangium duriaei CBS 260.36 TaxID=1168546 RepID=A0A9P4MQ68_9PEZI|nr:hypothetical protein K461DRAFT_111949 [Myriangium duriaei CBS 260.36]